MKTLSIIFLSLLLVSACATTDNNGQGNAYGHTNQPNNVQKATHKTNKELDDADRVIGTTERGVNTVEKTGNVIDRIGSWFD